MDEREQLSLPFSEPQPKRIDPAGSAENGLAPIISLTQRKLDAVRCRVRALNAAILARAEHVPSSPPRGPDTSDAS